MVLRVQQRGPATLILLLIRTRMESAITTWVGLESSLPARNFISINSTSTTILKVVYCSKSRVLNEMIAGPKAENGVKVDF